MAIKKTLLEIVQGLMASIEDDEINSISDTEASSRVAAIVEECYYDIISAADLPAQYDYFELETDADTTQPTIMTLPSNVVSLYNIKYDVVDTGDTSPMFRDVNPMGREDFMTMMYGFDPDDADVYSFTRTIGTSSINFQCYTDRAPSWYTTFDDATLVFDAYNSDVDTYLVANKTLGYGQVFPVFSQTDSYVPDLNPKQFSLLIQEAKAQTWYELKQQMNAKAESKARRNWIKVQRDKRAIPYPNMTYYSDLPNYGRKVR